MSGLEDWRRWPRVPISGLALWYHGGAEGQCKIVDLSVGGAAVKEPDSPLPVGTKLSFAIRVGGATISPVYAEVVRMAEGGLALRFTDLREEVRHSIEALMAQHAGSH